MNSIGGIAKSGFLFSSKNKNTKLTANSMPSSFIFFTVLDSGYNIASSIARVGTFILPNKKY